MPGRRRYSPRRSTRATVDGDRRALIAKMLPDEHTRQVLLNLLSNACKFTKVVCSDRPVTFAPGRGRLATRPLPTGSPARGNTIGIADVACFAASAGAVPAVTMTSTLSRTNSAAISANRSLRPSAHRYSMATVWPSSQPSACRRRTNAATHELWANAVLDPRYPMVRNLADCCALATNGQAAAAPPRSAMNCRRITRSPRRHGPVATAAHRGRAPWQSLG